MKWIIRGLTAVALLTASMMAGAATFTISLTENNLGDSGADWFGTFEAAPSGGALSSASVVVNGVTYFVLPPIFAPQYSPAVGAGLEGLIVDSSALDTPVLGINFTLPGFWNFQSCTFSTGGGGSGCGGTTAFAGTYTITIDTVPEPGALMLLGLGITGLALTCNRKA